MPSSPVPPPRHRPSSRSSAAIATTTTATVTGVGAARRVVRTRPHTATTTTTSTVECCCRSPLPRFRRVAGTTTSSSTTGIPLRHHDPPPPPTPSPPPQGLDGAHHLRQLADQRAPAKPPSLDLGGHAHSLSKTSLNEVRDTEDKVEAPQAKRLKTEQGAVKPARTKAGRTSTPRMPRTRSWWPSTSTTSLST